MGEKRELKVDVDELVSAVLREMQPGEDFDLALLRVLKSRYSEDHNTIFTAISHLIDARVRESGVPRAEAAQEIAPRPS